LFSIINQVFEELKTTSTMEIDSAMESDAIKIALPNISELIDQHDRHREIINNPDYDEAVKIMATNAFEKYKLMHPEQMSIFKFYRTFMQEIRTPNIITKLFYGMFQSHVQCSTEGCGYYSDVFDAFSSLQLNLHPTMTRMDVYDCMREHTKDEILSGTEQWKCDKCACKVNATKRITIALPPRVLVFQLKRFPSANKKDTRFVDFPIHGLKLDCMYPTDQIVQHQEYTYSLVSIVDHVGKGISGGHYYAYCKNGSNWFKYDDSLVTKITSDPSTLITSAAYLLTYMRSDCLNTDVEVPDQY
jgi:ubiquitin C-terminal hydrolase